MSVKKKKDRGKSQEKAWARESAKREASRAKSASAPPREPKPPREPNQDRRPVDFGFTIIDGMTGKVTQFDDREQGLSVARAMCACDEVDDAIARNDVLNDAMPTVPDDSGVANAVGHPLRAYGDNRMPVHLFPASKMFALMPCEAKDYRSLEVFRDMWVGSTYFKPMDASDFLTSICDGNAELTQLWEAYVSSEQRYMDDWALSNAHRTSREATVSAPANVVEMAQVLEEACAAYHDAHEVQRCADEDTFLCGGIHLQTISDERTERLLREAAHSIPHVYFGLDPDDARPHGFLQLTDDFPVLTWCAAGYLAAAEVLRSHGIGCAPWAFWD